MPEPVWLTYIGLVTGVVGMITGVSGAIMGYRGYRQSGRMKTIDLRLQLRKEESTLQAGVDDLPGLLDRAKKSHEAILSAIGLSQSGVMTKWLEDWGKDSTQLDLIKSTLPPTDNSYDDLTYTELESKLVDVHSLSLKKMQLQEKYNAILVADEAQRAQLKNAAQAAFISKSSSG